MATYWHRPLGTKELADYWSLFEKLDPRTARASREFWESLSVSELGNLKHQAWLTNDRDQYCIANTYIYQRAF